jgi:hypothetical protein
MELAGALSNASSLGKLDRLNGLRKRLLVEAASEPRPVKQLRLRNGLIQKAVIQALAAAPEPMRVSDVRTAVERLLRMPVSRHSVNSCLSKGARGSQARFERVGVGRYRLRG